MKKTIDSNDFHAAFRDANREDNFSFEGREELFRYLEELETDIGEQMELDIISLCCEYSEYKNLKEIQGEYPGIESLEDLRDKTQVIEFEGGIIIQRY